MRSNPFPHPGPTPSAPNHRLRCTACGALYTPDPFRLHCDADHPPALLRSEYQARQLQVQLEQPGLFRYRDWLPVTRAIDGPGKPITYQSEGLAQALGLKNLWISFNGYWPEKQARFYSCSFKELEALTVMARMPEVTSTTLVVASAGNTGRAFAQVGSRLEQSLCLVSAHKNIPAYWSHHPFSKAIALVSVVGNASMGTASSERRRNGHATSEKSHPGEADYTDAIKAAHTLSQLPDFFPEGGVYNVARRDGMGLTVVDATMQMQRIPDHYFQAVGSGSGGIAAWEAYMRLRDDGRFGETRMQLHLSQNLPFTPLVDAWRDRSRGEIILDEQAAKPKINQVLAQVLTTRNPAYAMVGGLCDALTATQGQMYGVSNPEVQAAMAQFLALEGIDISPAAGVATASLMQAVNAGRVKAEDWILLNITSGGLQRLALDYSLYQLEPTFQWPCVEGSSAELNTQVSQYFQDSVPA